MWSRKIKEIFAITTIGDGTVGFAALQGNSKVARYFANNPNYTRLLSLTHIRFVRWPATRQYREE